MKNKKKTKGAPDNPLSNDLGEFMLELRGISREIGVHEDGISELEKKVKELQSAFATHKKETELAFAKMEFIINNPPIYEAGDKVKAIDGEYIVTSRSVIQSPLGSFYWDYCYVKINKKKKWFEYLN